MPTVPYSWFRQVGRGRRESGEQLPPGSSSYPGNCYTLLGVPNER